jgi:hypothetical protein
MRMPPLHSGTTKMPNPARMESDAATERFACVRQRIARRGRSRASSFAGPARPLPSPCTALRDARLGGECFDVASRGHTRSRPRLRRSVAWARLPVPRYPCRLRGSFCRGGIRRSNPLRVSHSRQIASPIAAMIAPATSANPMNASNDRLHDSTRQRMQGHCQTPRRAAAI